MVQRRKERYALGGNGGWLKRGRYSFGGNGKCNTEKYVHMYRHPLTQYSSW